MAEVRQLLRAKARERGVRLDILEKDYALSYLLAAISEIPAFDAIVLKGGTALKKAYYADYRFSQDLDYSTLPAAPLSDLPQAMEAAIARMAERVKIAAPSSSRANRSFYGTRIQVGRLPGWCACSSLVSGNPSAA
jgi:predicted nucleotidyltransferase component of viral defense system